MKKSTTFFAVAIMALLFANKSMGQWSLTGNAGTAVNTNFLGTTDNKGLVFRTNNTERMRFTAAGLLGLGTTSPVSKFHVSGGTSTSLVNPGYIISGDVASYNLSLDNNELQARYDSTGSTLYLNYWGGNVWMGKTSTSYTPLVYANSTSNHTGIAGYDDANYFLNINADAVYGGIVVQNHSALLPSAYLQKTGPGAAMFAEKTNPNSFSYTIQANSSSGGAAVAAFSTASNCNAVYANASTANGIYATGGAGNYAGYFNGSVFTTGSYQSSDRNLKKNIRDLPNALALINQLQPKMYEYRNDGNYAMLKLPQGEQLGLIAQDVEKVLPELVKETTFDTRWSQQLSAEDAEKAKGETINFKTLNYTELIPLLIKGMQEQQAMIEKQNEKIEQLQNQIISNQSSSIEKKTIVSGGISLSQNIPNPFGSETKINCIIPSSVKSSYINIINADGVVVQAFSISERGNCTITVKASSLAAGSYSYVLIADGKIIDTKKMIVSR